MKTTKAMLACAALALTAAGCTTTTTAAPIDPQSCRIEGDSLSTATIAYLQCDNGKTEAINLKDKQGDGRLHIGSWTVTDTALGTADDDSFVRIQIQGADKQCTYGRSLNEAPQETWVSCTPLNELTPEAKLAS